MNENSMVEELQDALSNLMTATDDMLRALFEEAETIAHNPRIMLAMINLVAAKMQLGNIGMRLQDEED